MGILMRTSSQNGLYNLASLLSKYLHVHVYPGGGVHLYKRTHIPDICQLFGLTTIIYILYKCRKRIMMGCAQMYELLYKWIVIWFNLVLFWHVLLCIYNQICSCTMSYKYSVTGQWNSQIILFFQKSANFFTYSSFLKIKK